MECIVLNNVFVLVKNPSLLLGWDFFFKNNCKKVFLLTICLYICQILITKNKKWQL